jgi:hypothetical protein
MDVWVIMTALPVQGGSGVKGCFGDRVYIAGVLESVESVGAGAWRGKPVVCGESWSVEMAVLRSRSLGKTHLLQTKLLSILSHILAY